MPQAPGLAGELEWQKEQRMDQLDILKSPQGYAGQNRNLSSRWKAGAQRLCWTYN